MFLIISFINARIIISNTAVAISIHIAPFLPQTEGKRETTAPLSPVPVL